MRVARHSDNSAVGLAAEAFKAALDDSGLSREDVDGVATHYGAPLGVDLNRLAGR